MVLHICLNSWRSLEIQTNEDGRAADKEEEEEEEEEKQNPCFISSQIVCVMMCETERTFQPTWIHSDKEHVEKKSSQEDSVEREGACAAQQ